MLSRHLQESLRMQRANSARNLGESSQEQEALRSIEEQLQGRDQFLNALLASRAGVDQRRPSLYL